MVFSTKSLLVIHDFAIHGFFFPPNTRELRGPSVCLWTPIASKNTGRQSWKNEKNLRFPYLNGLFFDRSTLTAGIFGTSRSSETLCTSFRRSNQCVIGATKLKGVTPLLLWAMPFWKTPFYSYKWAKVPRFSVRSVYSDEKVSAQPTKVWRFMPNCAQSTWARIEYCTSF